MNIFYTNANPRLCALDHCKVHTRKMIVEYAQLLSAAHHVLDGDKATEGIYKLSHKNHPSAIWVRQSAKHYIYVLSLTINLCQIYSKSTGKQHATYSKILTLMQLPYTLDNKGFSIPPVVTPNEFKAQLIFGSTTEQVYKNYLNSKYKEWLSRDKKIDVSWYNDVPEWVDTNIQRYIENNS